MRKFTPTEIDLCKKIAEKERREIDVGDWYVENNEAKCWYWLGGNENGTIPPGEQFTLIPLWQEHDCLEFLREKGWRSYMFSFDEKGVIGELSVVHVPFKFSPDHQIITTGKTFLEALLHAVLEALKI